MTFADMTSLPNQEFALQNKDKSLFCDFVASIRKKVSKHPDLTFLGLFFALFSKFRNENKKVVKTLIMILFTFS
jgi:hypothetical protein